MPDNNEILRGVIKQVDVGTPGAGLLSPEQFDAFFALAETKHPWAQKQSSVRRNAHTGGIPRIDFGDDVLEPADEAVDTGNYLKPAHDFVPYALKKTRLSFRFSKEVQDQTAAGSSYESQVVDGFTAAFGRSKQRLLWLGDTASANPTMALLDGWRKRILGGGHQVDGSTINGGVLSLDHFYAAVFSLPEAWKQRASELSWAMSPTKRWEISRFISGRSTGAGDDALMSGGGNVLNILGIPVTEVPELGKDIVLVSPANTTEVVKRNDMRLTRVDTGIEAVAQDIVAYIGFMYIDAIMREPEGSVIVHSLA